MSKLNECLIHLDNNEGVLDRQTRQKIYDDVMALNKKDLQYTEEELMRRIRDQISEGIDKTNKFVHDTILVKKLKEGMFKDRVTGKELKTLKQVLTQRRDELVGRNSVDTRVRNFRNRLINDYDSYEIKFGVRENKQFKSLRDIADGSPEEDYIFKKIAGFTEEMTPSKLSDTAIKAMTANATELDRIAYSMLAYNAHARDLANSNGMAIRYNKNYVMKRRYDMGAINRKFGEDRSIARKAFSDYMYEKLDVAQTFGQNATQVQAKGHLMELYDELRQSAGERTSVDNPREFNTDRANSISRKLAYKDADASYAAFKDLSVGGMRDQFDRNARSLASSIVRAQEFGYNAPEVRKQLFDFQEARVGKERTWSESRLEMQIRNAEKELLGSMNYVQTGLTDFANAAKFTQGAMKLGAAIKVGMMDVMESNRMVFFNEGKWFGGITDWLGTFAKTGLPEKLGGMSIEEKQRMASDLGVVFNYFSSGEAMRMAQGDMATTGSKISGLMSQHGSKVMNIATLLPWQAGSSKMASAMVGANSFARVIKNPTGKFEADVLKIYKITPNEVALLNHAKMEKTTHWGGDGILTGAGIRRVMDNLKPEEVGNILGVGADQVARSVMNLSEKYEVYLNDSLGWGTPAPELKTKIAIPGKMSEDETTRVISSLLTQFLDTPIAQSQNFFEMIEKVKRVNGGVWNASAVKDLAPYMATYTVMATSAYLAFDGIYSMIFGEESLIEKFNKGDEKARNDVMWRVIDRSSPVPFVFNALESQLHPQYNKSAVDTFNGGPVRGLLHDTLQLAQPTGKGWEKDLGKFMKKQGPQRMMPIRFINNRIGE